MNPNLPVNSTMVGKDGAPLPVWYRFFSNASKLLVALTQSGTTAQRPTSFLWIGRPYFNRTLVMVEFWDGAGWVSPGAGGGAPTSATYVTLSTNATLTAERTAAVTSPITLTDGGANNPVTWAFDQSVTLGNNARVAVTRNSAATISTRRKLNFIESGIITIGVVDDGAGEETEITIGAVGGGTTVISGAATVDFGNTPGVEDGVTTVTVASASVGAGSRFRVAPRYSSALTDHDADDYAAEGISAIIGTVTPGVGFDIIASANDATWGQYNIDWAYS